MMNKKAVLFRGYKIPFRLEGENYVITSLEYNLWGTVDNFTAKKRDSEEVLGQYIYVFSNNYLAKDVKRAIIGFCKTDIFTLYANGSLEYEDLVKKENWFDEVFEKAQIGDVFEIEALEFPEPYTSYYHRIKNIFKIQSLEIDFSNPNEYPPFDPDENSDTYYTIEDTSVNLLEHPSGKFFTKNFGSKVSNFGNDFSHEEKQKLAELATRISFCIHWAFNQLHIIAMGDIILIQNAMYEYYVNDNPSLYNNLSGVDKIVGILIKNWGYAKSLSGNLYAEPTDLLTETSVNAYSSYYNAVNDFRRRFKYIKEVTLFKYDNDDNPLNENGWPLTKIPSQRPIKDSERRIKFLIKMLTNTALKAIPIEQRLEILDRIIEMPEIYEDTNTEINESDVLKLLSSFTGTEEADKLLDFLCSVKNGEKTRFEILYYLMDDARLERYIFINWFVTDANNREYFIHLVFEMWKISKYNMCYVPEGGDADENDINLDAFFLTPQGLEYVFKDDNQTISKNIVLEKTFESYSGSIRDWTATDVWYEVNKNLERELVVVDVKTKIVGFNASNTKNESGLTTSRYKATFEKYHLYQPIQIAGYDVNGDFALADYDALPAFLYYYSFDFMRLKKYDATINFIAEATIELSLFVATGGLGAFRHIRHLTKCTKIWNALTNPFFPSQEAVIVWRGVEASSEVLSLTGALLTSTAQLIKNTSNDAPTKALMDKLSGWFLFATLVSAGGAGISRYRGIKSADDVLREIDVLSNNGIPHNVSDDVLDVLYTIRNTANVSKTIFRNRISSLTLSDLGESNHIIDVFDNLSDIEKTKFWAHFANRAEAPPSNPNSWKTEDLDFWKAMNKTEDGFPAIRTKIWTEVTEDASGVLLRKDIQYLDDFVTFRYNFDEANWVHINTMIAKLDNLNYKYIGGHTNINKANVSGVEVISGNFDRKWIIIDNLPTIGINQNINNLSTYIVHPKGHIKYLGRSIYYRHPSFPIYNSSTSSTQYVINGKIVRRIQKSEQTIINPEWSEAKIIQEYVYALNKRRSVGSPINTGELKYGKNYPQIIREYESIFSDGTPVIIKWKNYELQDGIIVEDYYYFQIEGF